MPVVAGLEGSFSEIVQGFANLTWNVGLFAEFQCPLIVGQSITGLAFG